MPLAYRSHRSSLQGLFNGFRAPLRARELELFHEIEASAKRGPADEYVAAQ